MALRIVLGMVVFLVVGGVGDCYMMCDSSPCEALGSSRRRSRAGADASKAPRHHLSAKKAGKFQGGMTLPFAARVLLSVLPAPPVIATVPLAAPTPFAEPPFAASTG